MEWYYKSELPAHMNNTNILKVELTGLLGDRLFGVVGMYTDGNDFYLKTTNNIALQTFLWKHRFEELYHEPDFNELEHLFGMD